jgi:hypothetical protein
VSLHPTWRVNELCEPPPGDEGPDAESLRVWWRWSRVDLSLKQQLVVWVVPNWDVGDSLAMAGSASQHLVDHPQ